jgi:tetraacyldisaccharide 4'-kinase
MRVADRVWYEESAGARLVRAALAPLAAVYLGATRLRNALYDRGALPVAPSAVPALSIGNLTVGGAGKTPVAAWFATTLRDRGARPAVVLRGYGGDESLVHETLNPAVPVIVDADRARGLTRARAAGCDVAVLDDAFQHRRVARLEDVVLLSADRWGEPVRALPAGPWREPLSALARASLLVVTRKSAASEPARALANRFAGATRTGAAAVAALTPDALRHVWEDRSTSLDALRGRRVTVLAGIADPRAFADQLTAAGAVVDLVAFADHRRFSARDVRRAVARAETGEWAVCTLKDAVKLRHSWPRQAPALWYVSLRCRIEQGADAVDTLLRRLLLARPDTKPGSAG